jgi:serine protease
MLKSTYGLLSLAVLCSASAGIVNATETNPYSPRFNHEYRHGAHPTLSAHANVQAYKKANAVRGAIPAQPQLAYNGGVNGIGVTSGTPRVYLVVYGSQWGTAGTDANGNTTLSGDKLGAVPYLQKMFKGLGTGNEGWSGVMTQYCDGPLVATGSKTCPSSAPHVGYPTGGAFAGIWYDNSAASPASATGTQLANEAIKAAAHFGNTTAASNRYVQYVILSPSGTTPDGFNTPSGTFCAWHDFTGDSTLPGGPVSSPYGDIAFTNMPYVADAGSGCGQNYVNAGTAGLLDGFSIVEGHEYAETITDQNPAGGWVNPTDGGSENGDECAWISTGQGASANVVMGNGTYAMQSTWSNDTNRCDITHVTVTGGSGVAISSQPANVTVAAGSTASFSVTATGGTAPYKYQWKRGGVAITGATSASYSFTTVAADNGATFSVTVTDSATTPASVTSNSATLTVTSGSTGSQLIANGGFESGATSWAGTTASIGTFTGEPAKTGTKDAWLGGNGTATTEAITQTVVLPAAFTTATLSFDLHIDTAETTTTTAYDKMTVTLKTTGGTVISTVASYSNLNKAAGYTNRSFNVSSALAAYKGQSIVVSFSETEDSSLQTSFVLDNVSLIAQ